MEPNYLFFECSYIHWITPVYGFWNTINKEITRSGMVSTVPQIDHYGKIANKDQAKWFKCGSDGWS